jgi:hypothetical protein
MLDEISRRLAAGPAHFPHTLDPVQDRLLLIALREEEFAAASFLDQRILTSSTKGDWASLADIAARLDAQARDDAHYIFHIGHVGSTLMSRLLGSVPGILALREPLLLRSLADLWARKDAVDAPWDPTGLPARTLVLRRLLSRTFRPDQRAIIKATSFTSEIAPQMVAHGARALFLHVSPQSYMRTILAGEGSRQALATLTGPRLVRLARRLPSMPFRLWSLDEGSRVALAWVTEMLSLSAAEAALPAGSVLWLDFDRFLIEPEASLLQIARHFGLPVGAEDAARIAASPIMLRYSKAPEHRYDAALRRSLQLQAASEHGGALRAGAEWLDRLAREHDEVARLRGVAS